MLTRPSEALFEALATEDPVRLVAFLNDPGLDPTFLTFAAELAGRVPEASLVVPPLLALLVHPKAYVREGAVYGLAHHLEAPGVREALVDGMYWERSLGVRAAIVDALNTPVFVPIETIVGTVRPV